MLRHSRTFARLAVVGVLVAAVTIAPAPIPAGAVTVFSISPPLAGGHIAIDGATYGSACPGHAGCVFWDASGAVAPSLAGLPSGPGVRLRLFPHISATSAFGTYDPWTAAAGGAFVSVRGPDVGNITLPTAANGAVRPIGTVIAHDGVAGGRLHIEASQYDGLRTTSGGQEEGAFASLDGRGGQYSLGFVWKARYVVDITDQATGVAVHGFMDVGDSLPTIDLDAVCFGLALCNYSNGSFGSVSGGFHSVSPTRILDTRVPIGITNGPLRQGDGRMLTEPDSARRADELVNHELQVTGMAGIPTSGASAVVLNVTASQPSNDGFLSAYPSLPRGLRNPADGARLLDDQSSFLDGYPNVSNLNFRAGQDVANLVVARIGAGGKIRFSSSAHATQIIADVVGWIDSGASRAGFVGMTPTRLADTRFGVGLGGRVQSGQTRSLVVSPAAAIPAGVDAVVLNVTADNPSDISFVTVFPTGIGVPTASNLNTRPGGARANLVVAPVGAGGRVSFYLDVAKGGSADIIVDAVGYFVAGGGQVVALTPQRVMDTRFGQGTSPGPFGPGERRNVQISGNAGVPADASAVFVNITAVNPNATGFLTTYPADAPVPNASNINYTVGNTVPNLVMVPIDAAGSISILNSAAATDVLADVVAYATTTPLTVAAAAARPKASVDCTFVRGVKAAFCDTFDHPSGDPATRSGDLNAAIWGVSRTNTLVNFSQGQLNDWRPATLTGCGTPTAVRPPGDVRICSGRVIAALADGEGQSILALYPKQPFDIAGRTGTVVFDVSADSQGPHAAWPEFWWTDQPVPAPTGGLSGQSPHARNSLGVSFALQCGGGGVSVDRMFVTRNYQASDLDVTHGACITKGSASGALNHIEMRVAQDRVEVWGTDAGSSVLKLLATAPNANLTMTRGLIWVENVHYNGCKFDTQCDHGFAFDNVGFDGPSPYRDLSFDVPDASPTRLGFATPVALKTVPVYRLQTPTSALVTFNWFATTSTVPSVRLNGGAWHDTAWPFDGLTYAWRTIGVTVPVSEVHDGVNTVELASPTGVVLSNVNVILIAGSPA
jgi:hypothetical protein